MDKESDNSKKIDRRSALKRMGRIAAVAALASVSGPLEAMASGRSVCYSSFAPANPNANATPAAPTPAKPGKQSVRRPGKNLGRRATATPAPPDNNVPHQYGSYAYRSYFYSSTSSTYRSYRYTSVAGGTYSSYRSYGGNNSSPRYTSYRG